MVKETIKVTIATFLFMNLAGKNRICYLKKKTVSAHGKFNCGFFTKSKKGERNNLVKK